MVTENFLIRLTSNAVLNTVGALNIAPQITLAHPNGIPVPPYI